MLNYVNEMLTEAKIELELLTHKYGQIQMSKLERLEHEKHLLLSSLEGGQVVKELEGIDKKIEVLQRFRSKKAYDKVSYLEERRREGELILEEDKKRLEEVGAAIRKEHTKIVELKAFISELEGYDA